MRRDPLRVPIQVPFISVDNVAWLFQSVKLFGINNQFSRNIETAHSLIHLLRVSYRDVEIALAAKKKGDTK